MTTGAGVHAGPVYVRSWDAFQAGQTGLRVMDPASWAEGQIRQGQLSYQTRVIVAALGGQGVDCHRQGEQFYFIGLCTGEVKAAPPPLRALMILPDVAASRRAPLIRELEYFLSKEDWGRYARLAVLTTGERCPVEELGARFKWAFDRIRHWHNEVCKPLGIEVLLRTSEWTVKFPELTFHPHVNIVYVPTRMLPAHQWDKFLRDSQAFFGVHWQEAGKLRDVREAIKYVMKGNEGVRLAREAPETLEAVYEQTLNRKLLHPMGAFAAFRKALYARRGKIVSEYFSGRRCLVETERPKRPRSFGAPLYLEANNTVMGVMAASTMFCHYREPVVLLSRLVPEILHCNTELRELKAKYLGAWKANGAPDPQDVLFEAWEAFRVHTYTVTVGEGGSRGRVSPAETGPDLIYAARSPP